MCGQSVVWHIAHIASWKLLTVVRYDYLLWALAGIQVLYPPASPALVRFVLACALGASPLSPFACGFSIGGGVGWANHGPLLSGRPGHALSRWLNDGERHGMPKLHLPMSPSPSSSAASGGSTVGVGARVLWVLLEPLYRVSTGWNPSHFHKS